jgi:hypothetical protein
MKGEIQQATGQYLTLLGETLGAKRKRFLFFFREPDFLFRRRLVEYLTKRLPKAKTRW